MRDIQIVNYHYQLTGKDYFFTSYQEAIDHLRTTFPETYKYLVNPMFYVRKLTTSLYEPVGRDWPKDKNNPNNMLGRRWNDDYEL